MESLYDYIKRGVVNFKLDECCCLAPIKIGLFAIGYLNIFIALLFLVGTADDSFLSPLMRAQDMILEDTTSKPIAVVAYSIEVAFNSLLLCGLYRNDIVLLRVYMYFVFAAIISSFLVYSIVFIGLPLFMEIAIVTELVFQCYVIILVRSAIVEIKESRTSEKNGHVTLYSVARMSDDTLTLPTKNDQPDVEAVVESTSEDPSDKDANPEQKKDAPTIKLETVNENPKEE